MYLNLWACSVLTAVGIPARSARLRPSTPSLLDSTRTILAALWLAGFSVQSIKACRLVPEEIIQK